MTPGSTQTGPLCRRLSEQLIDHYADAQSIRALVESSGGDFSAVGQAGRTKDLLFNAIRHLSQRPASVRELWLNVQGDDPGYVTHDVAQILSDLLDQSAAADDRTWPLKGVSRIDFVNALVSVFPNSDTAMDIGRSRRQRSEELLPQPEFDLALLQDDGRRTWRNLVTLSTLHPESRVILRSLLATATDKADQLKDAAGAAGLRELQHHMDAAGSQRGSASRGQLSRATSSGQQRPSIGVRGRRESVQTQPRQEAPTSATTGFAHYQATLEVQDGIPSAGRPPGPDGKEKVRQAFKAKVKRSALETLDSLRQQMDTALGVFSDADAHGVGAIVDDEDRSVQAYEITVAVLRKDLEDQFESGRDAEARATLQSLIATCIEGIGIAEEEKDYGAVDRLAHEAAGAYSQAAEHTDGPDQEIFSRVVPYWKMKAIHAGHQLSTEATEDELRRLARQRD